MSDLSSTSKDKERTMNMSKLMPWKKAEPPKKPEFIRIGGADGLELAELLDVFHRVPKDLGLNAARIRFWTRAFEIEPRLKGRVWEVVGYQTSLQFTEDLDP
jgi:hypothetical protein